MRINITDNDRTITLDVPEEHFVELIEEDQQLRAIETGDSHTVRTPQEILDDRFNNPDSNAHHNYWRQDRKGVRFFSLEVWNEYGNQADASDCSAEEAYVASVQAEEQALIMTMLRDLIAEFTESLPTVQREVFIAWHYQGMTATDIARERNVSKAAISKTLNDKIIPKLKDTLAARGLTLGIYLAF